jgi:hypothetical protein
MLGLSPLFLSGISGLLVDAPAVYGFWFLLTSLAVLGGILLDTIFDYGDRRLFYHQAHLLGLATAWLATVITGIIATSLASIGTTTFWAILAVIYSVWRLADIVSLAALESADTQQNFINWLNHDRPLRLNPDDRDAGSIELDTSD